MQIAGRTGFTLFYLRRLIFAVASLAALGILFLVGIAPQTSRAQERDFSVYERAVEFCRGNVSSNVERPLTLDPDKRVLCFDGPILPEQDFSLAKALEVNGLFVVRSPGGYSPPAIALANMMRDRHATVVIYDYCLSACANSLLVASDETFVMKDTLVAWHHTTWSLCSSLQEAKDGGPDRLEKMPCFDTPSEMRRAYLGDLHLLEYFYSTRILDPLFELPPESVWVRLVLKMMFERTHTYPDILWTWNPRHYASTLKTKITYEAYPHNQDEVDALASKIHPSLRVLYDP